MKKYGQYELPDGSRKSRLKEEKFYRDGEGNKHCPTCDRWLATDNFFACNRSNGRGDGYSEKCKKCYKMYALWKRYKVTKEWYESKLIQQNNQCAICSRTPEGVGNDVFNIDHDHSCCPGANSCGRCVRGLLCSQCNSMLGYSKDLADNLIKGAQYLADYM